MSTLDADSMSAQSRSPPSAFTYSPLEVGSFRLLWIERVSDGHLVCTIRHFPIHEYPEYFALSYVWGDGAQDREILANEALLYISRHLLQGMSNMLLLFERDHPDNRWLWIDAVCIDQRNPEEKAIQVPLMGEIYSRAQQVLIWCGDTSDHDVDALCVFRWLFWFNAMKNSSNEDFTKGCITRCKELECLLAEIGIEEENLVALFNFTAMFANISEEHHQGRDQIKEFKQSRSGEHMLPQNHELWLHVLKILNHEWFWRIWTIQEIKLAKNATIVLGQCNLPWNFLDKLRRVLRHEHCVGTLFTLATSLQFGYDEITRTSVDARNFSPVSTTDKNKPIYDFQFLLLGISRHRTTIPKNYIYGLLGIVEESVRSRITVDYTDLISTAAVFTQAVMVACNLYRGGVFWTMLMELYMGMSNEVNSLPSWVPDFSSSSVQGSPAEFCGGPRMSASVRDKYKPLARISFQEDATAAILRGKTLDRVISAITSHK